MSRDVAGGLIAALMNSNGRMISSDDDSDGLSIGVDVQIERLTEMFRDYRAVMENGVPFKAGDIVTPKAQYSYKGFGRPFIVLETRRHAEPNWQNDDTSSRNGRRLNMRVSNFLDNDNITTFWVEGFEFDYFPKPE